MQFQSARPTSSSASAQFVGLANDLHPR